MGGPENGHVGKGVDIWLDHVVLGNRGPHWGSKYITRTMKMRKHLICFHVRTRPTLLRSDVPNQVQAQTTGGFTLIRLQARLLNNSRKQSKANKCHTRTPNQSINQQIALPSDTVTFLAFGHTPSLWSVVDGISADDRNVLADANCSQLTRDISLPTFASPFSVRC
jgi:hypothetical protein